MPGVAALNYFADAQMNNGVVLEPFNDGLNTLLTVLLRYHTCLKRVTSFRKRIVSVFKGNRCPLARHRCCSIRCCASRQLCRYSLIWCLSVLFDPTILLSVTVLNRLGVQFTNLCAFEKAIRPEKWIINWKSRHFCMKCAFQRMNASFFLHEQKVVSEKYAVTFCISWMILLCK